MKEKKIFEIPIDSLSYKQILEKIEKYLQKPAGFFHIVSVNPENLVIANKNFLFKKALLKAQIRIVDGIGVVIASFLLNFSFPPKVTGVDLMIKLLELANKKRLRVMLLGGKDKIAEKVVNCQRKNFPQVKFFALQGIKNIKTPKKSEEEKIFSIVSNFKPHFLFVAFGSPYQELWLDRHQKKLKGIVCMGVGGGFDYLAKEVPRAPKLIRILGFEWLFRLIIQPWRWRRQLRLIEFTKLIFCNLIKRIFSFFPRLF